MSTLSENDLNNLTPVPISDQTSEEPPPSEESNDESVVDDLPIVKIFGRKIDTDSLYLFLVSMVVLLILIIILIYSGLWKNYFGTFVLIYVLISIFNLFNSSNNVVSDITIGLLEIQSQDNFVQGSISIFILVFVFLDSIKMTQEQKFKIYQMLIITLLLSSSSLFIYNYKNHPRNIRTLRKTKLFLFNQSLLLFCITLYMIFLTQKVGNVVESVKDE